MNLESADKANLSSIAPCSKIKLHFQFNEIRNVITIVQAKILDKVISKATGSKPGRVKFFGLSKSNAEEVYILF